MNYDDELSLEELEQVTAGLPDLSKLDAQEVNNRNDHSNEVSSSVSKFETVKPQTFGNEYEISRRETIVEESMQAVKGLPEGELFEDDLDAIMGGRTK